MLERDRLRYEHDLEHSPHLLTYLQSPSSVMPGRSYSSNMNFVHLNKTHGAMIRYSDAEDEDYQKVSSCLVSMARDLLQPR